MPHLFRKGPKDPLWNGSASGSWCCLAALFSLLGCRCPSPDVLQEVEAPLHNAHARVQRNDCTRASGSPIYSVVLQHTGTNGVETALELNEAKDLHVLFSSFSELLIECPGCDLHGYDVHFFRLKVGEFSVVYKGIPLPNAKLRT